MSKSAGRIANSVDPDQTSRSAASDLCLRCLIRTLVLDNSKTVYNQGFIMTLTFITLWENSADDDDKMVICFSYFSPQNKI